MCGIAGVLGDDDPESIVRITAALRHRGPDHGGHYHRGGLHLGMRRLAIIDLATGDQPIADPARGRSIVMNGEIYNYRELRRELIGRGHRFETHSDTEVALRLFDEFGADGLRHLRGMFALAIADGDRLFIARDRLGIKPLYYCHLESAGLFFFASEIKALLACPEISSALSERALGDLLLMRHPFGADTPFEQIRSLEPGCWLEARRGESGLTLRQQRYYTPPSDSALEDGDFEAAIAVLREKLEETVEAHFTADVEVGLLLSGGIDSGLLAALASQGGQRNGLRTFTVAASPRSPEASIAAGIAARLGTRHEALHPRFEDFLAAIPSFLLSMEGSTSLAGLSAFLLCRQVGARLKVCLNGEGADEIFGGYEEFLDGYPDLDELPQRLSAVRSIGLGSSPILRERVRALLAARREGRPAYLRELFRWHRADRLVHHHLLFMDRIGMAAGLEIRVPYVDHELVELAASLPMRFKVDSQLRIQKHILKRVALDTFGSLLATPALRSKSGFPAADWFHQAAFRKLCRERLGEKYLASHPLGSAFRENADLLLFELFEHLFIARRGTLPAGFDLDAFISERTPPKGGGLRTGGKGGKAELPAAEA